MKYICFILSTFIMITVITACNEDGDSSDNPKSKIMLFSSNWGDDSIKITDDILNYVDGSTAVPRVISGGLTTIAGPGKDSIAVDKNRSILYLTDDNIGLILVYENIKSIEGNLAPDRTISVTGEDSLEGIAIDSSRDILYVSGTTDSIWKFNNASTLDGAQTPDAILSYDVMSIFIDERNNRLYAGAYYDGYGIYIFDNASSLTTGSIENRTITFADSFDPCGLWVDPSSDRLYTGNRAPSPDGYYLFIFENASTMNGAYTPDDDSVARISNESISLMVDSKDNLYSWPDSATSVRIYYNARTLSGDISAPDKTINGVVDRGYGMDYLAY